MADAIHRTSNELSAIVPQVWSSKYYETLLAELPFASLISRDWEGEIANLGDSVNISQFPEFDDATELAEDAANEASAVTVGGQQLVINKRVVKDFIITKKAITQSLEAMNKLRELAIYAVLKKINATIIGTIVPSASAPDHAIGFASGTTFGLADILAAKELLDAQNVPMSDRSMVFGAAAGNDLFNITGFTSADFVLAGAPLQSGQLPPALLGFQPKMTTAAGAVVYLFHKSFMTLAMQEGMNVAEYDLGVEGKRAVRVNVDTLYGLKQLDSKRVVTVS